MFDAGRPLNCEHPARFPLKPQGDRPVIVRTLWRDREEFVPGRAIRWTTEHVMVCWLTDPADVRSERCHWFRADDVSTTLPKRPSSPRGEKCNECIGKQKSKNCTAG